LPRQRLRSRALARWRQCANGASGMEGEKEAREYTSPDGLLTLVVTIEANDTTIGFAGYPSHSHGGILFATYGLEELDGLGDADAVNKLASMIMNNELVIGVFKNDGKIVDVFFDNPAFRGDSNPLEPNESIEYRRWNGDKVVLA
jgi:hypothetical protein